MERLFLAGVWIVTLGLVIGAALAFRQLSDSPPLAPPEPLGWKLGARTGAAGATAPGTAWGAWRVVDYLSAHHVAVVDVETDRPQDARRIATILVEPLTADDYAEIILYFHRPGPRDGLPARRIQWSPRAGYVETIYEDRPAPRSTPADR